VAVKYRDYYEVLGVPRTATADDIKRAYRTLARKHHPDLQTSGERDKAAERFKEINEAYEVLSDAEKRAKYDALGSEWRKGMDFTPPAGESPPGQSGFGTWGNLDEFSDFFASMFGRTGRQHRGRSPTRRPGRDLEAEIPLSLEDLLHPGRRRINLGDRHLDIDIPRGVRDGTVLRLAGQGGPGVSGEPAGDLYLHVRVLPHARYRRLGDDLEIDLPLWPWQAVLGDQVEIETLDGRVALKVPPGTQSGQRLRLRGRGLPRADGSRGDLFASIRIVVPERPSRPEREAYEALKRVATAAREQPIQA
jgi:curved DNA-binding protein